MPTYRLTIEYEGTRYSGWQAQENTSRTIQGILLEAARAACGSATIGGAGRTDGGVHAVAQVAHLRTSARIKPFDLRRQLNDALPADINVLRVDEAKEGFHARHDAHSRIYLYQIARRRTAFAKAFVWWIRDPLDMELMRSAASHLLGKHDFSAFADKRVEEEASTMVVVDRVEIGEEGDLLLIRIGASHFLWKMVRKLVAVLAEVGRGSIPPTRVQEMLERGAPRFQPSAPASGLFLESVLYEADVLTSPLRSIIPVPSLGGKDTWGRAKKR